MADPGEGPGGAPAPPLFLDQTEARSAEIFFFLDRAPRPYPRENDLPHSLLPYLRI